MFLSIDNPIITDESSFLDRLGLGGQTLLLGMVVVFAMLFVIYLCMVAMQAVFTRKSQNRKGHSFGKACASAGAGDAGD